MEKNVNRMYPCPVTGQREYYLLPESEIERFNHYITDIQYLKDNFVDGKDIGGGFMQTCIEFSDAFSKFLIKKEVLLLDIDYTIFDENTPRPFLKEFMERMMQKYSVHFYTAGNRMRVTEVLRVFHSKFGMSKQDIRFLQAKALTRENCPMITFKKKDGSSIGIKCFEKASEILKVPVEDMIMLDDNPAYDHPYGSQIIQAEGFMKDRIDDDYLNRVDL